MTGGDNDDDDDDCNKCDQKTGCCWLMMRPAGHSHSFTRPPATITKPGLRGDYVDDDVDNEEEGDYGEDGEDTTAVCNGPSADM